MKNAVRQIIKDKTFDFDEWLAALNEKIAPLKLNRTDMTELCLQFETLAQIFNEPQLLLDLSTTELDPIREIVNALSEKFSAEEKGFKRRKILTHFLNNELSNATALKYFPGDGFMKLMRDYPKANKIYELLVEDIFSVSVPTETFLSIADKYYRIKDERNHSAHAREDYGEFKTAEKLRSVMNEGLKEIQALLLESRK